MPHLGAVELLELAVAALPAQDQKLVSWKEFVDYKPSMTTYQHTLRVVLVKQDLESPAI